MNQLALGAAQHWVPGWNTTCPHKRSCNNGLRRRVGKMIKRNSSVALVRASVLTGLLPVSLMLGACAISQQQEMQLGAQSASDINRQLPIVSDADVHRYINVLGDQIGRYGSRGIDYTFYVVNSSVVNAFSVPGYVYVDRGLIDRTSNWSELA